MLIEHPDERATRARVAARDGLRLPSGAWTYNCRYCRRSLAYSEITVDHIVPLSAGGVNTLTNACIACAPCNGRKGSMSADAFERVRKLR